MKTRSTFALVAAFSFSLLSASAFATDVFVDFGTPATPSPAGWNDCRALIRSGSATLETTSGAYTGYTLSVTKGFTDHQPYGIASVPGLPTGATIDGMYGNELEYENYSSPYGELELTGLNPSVTYNFTFYAGVDKDDNYNRTTRYFLAGASNYSGTLNPTNNTTQFVNIPMKPSSTGVITITVSTGTGNDTPQGFYHIGNFRMSYTLPTTNNPPVVNALANPATMTLPTNSTTLSSNATDVGGSVSSYLWTKVSGGGATFATPTAKNTVVSGLSAGTYVFNVRVIDNLGAIVNDRVTVTVNSSGTLSAPSYRLYNANEIGNPYGYAEYLPRGYAQAADDSLGLVIFLHGVGEMGEGKRDPNFSSTISVTSAGGGIGGQTYSSGGVSMAYVNKLLLFGPNTYIRSGHDLPFVVLSIQQFYAPCPGACDWSMDKVNQFVTYALGKYKINPKKVHVTGLSLGGGGSLNYALTYPDRIASLATMCSGYYNNQSLSLTQGLINNGVGVWAATSIIDPLADFQTRLRQFVSNMGYSLGSTSDILYHFTNPDGAIPKTTNPENVTNINNVLPSPLGAWSATYNPTYRRWDWRQGQEYRMANGSLPAYPMHFTIYTDVHSHYIWDRMYNDPKLYEWMGQQSR